MKISFYYVDEKYIEYLKRTEINTRNFTTVPNVKYANSEKFVYGAVMEIDGMDYFVPVSSYKKEQEDNIVIKVKDRNSKKGKAVGSLRFNYMIPVPKNCLYPVDFKNDRFTEKDKILLEKEYRFCKSKRSAIQKQAQRTYNRVISCVDSELVRNSCDFKLLEKAYEEFVNNNR